MVQEDHSLKGKTIVVTRPREQAQETAKAIKKRGGKTYLFPTIEIQASTDLSSTKSFFKALANKKVDYVILMSVNGVQHLIQAAQIMGVVDEVKKELQNTVVIAVGPKTAAELKKNGIHVDLIPEEYTSEGILQSLKQSQVSGKSIYIPRTSEAPPDLSDILRKMGNRVEEVYVYRSQLPTDRKLAAKFVDDLAEGKIDAIFFSSSLGVKNFCHMLNELYPGKELNKLIEKTVTVAIGPTTAKTLADANVKVNVMPKKSTIDDAIEALIAYWNRDKANS